MKNITRTIATTEVSTTLINKESCNSYKVTIYVQDIQDEQYIKKCLEQFINDAYKKCLLVKYEIV